MGERPHAWRPRRLRLQALLSLTTCCRARSPLRQRQAAPTTPTRAQEPSTSSRSGSRVTRRPAVPGHRADDDAPPAAARPGWATLEARVAGPARAALLTPLRLRLWLGPRRTTRALRGALPSNGPPARAQRLASSAPPARGRRRRARGTLWASRWRDGGGDLRRERSAPHWLHNYSSLHCSCTRPRATRPVLRAHRARRRSSSRSR